MQGRYSFQGPSCFSKFFLIPKTWRHTWKEIHLPRPIIFGILCQILGCFFASYISWWVTNCQHDEWQMFTSQLSNWEPFLHNTQGKHVQKFLKQLGLWARTDQHITNHWIILFLDIQSNLLRFGVLCMLLGFKYLLRRCLCFVLNSQKNMSQLGLALFFQNFVHPKVDQKPAATHGRPFKSGLGLWIHPTASRADRPTYSKYSKTPYHLGRLEGERSPGLGGFLITMIIFTTYELERSSKQGWTAEMLQRPLEITKGIRNPIQQTGMGRFRTAVNDLRPHNTLNSPQFAKKNGITVFSR